MLFDWSITTTVVEFCGRNETVRGLSSAARQTAIAASATRAPQRTSRTIVVRRSWIASADASPSGMAPRRRRGSLAASSDAVTVGPPLEVAADLGCQRGRPLGLGRGRRPRQLLRGAGEAAE